MPMERIHPNFAKVGTQVVLVPSNVKGPEDLREGTVIRATDTRITVEFPTHDDPGKFYHRQFKATGSLYHKGEVMIEYGKDSWRSAKLRLKGDPQLDSLALRAEIRALKSECADKLNGTVAAHDPEKARELAAYLTGYADKLADLLVKAGE